jgi:hypothetical protein
MILRKATVIVLTHNTERMEQQERYRRGIERQERVSEQME